ncbi:MAG TPA: hypothetical protein ENH82_06885 [bacterium]|nr:hypothetical protein [bacterium]
MVTLASPDTMSAGLSRAINISDTYSADWNKWIRDILGVKLDPDQRLIVESIQHERRTGVSSGNGRGKDYTTAAVGLTFHYNLFPSKVICTGPTDRQVKKIVLAEMKNMWMNAKIPLGGNFNADGLFHEEHPNWYILGFKAMDKAIEDWSGFHSQHICVLVTEATGVEQETYGAIDGILTGTVSRLALIFNPNNTSGEAYNSIRSPLYKSHRLNCMDAPNVVARKIIYPGQVDWEWIDEKTKKPGWIVKISKQQMDKSQDDFKWEGNYFRPSDLFRIKVMGLPPRESSDVVIPLAWVEAANERWYKLMEKGIDFDSPKFDFRLGVDVAGQGRDLTVFAPRYTSDDIDMFAPLETHGKINNIDIAYMIRDKFRKKTGTAFIDTIGEGAGAHQRLEEFDDDGDLEGVSVSTKYSESAEGTDITGEREFANKRAHLYWQLRDQLDPQFDPILALPPDPELTQELTELRKAKKQPNNGKILLEPKEDLEIRLGRHPDKSDAVANTNDTCETGEIRWM